MQVLKLTNGLFAQIQDLSDRVATLESEKKEAIDGLAQAIQANKTALEGKDKEIYSLKADIAQLQSREVNQGALLKTTMKKVMQTTDFGELCVKLSAAATSIGKHETLKSLMAACPQLKLRKKELGWDPYAENRANKQQQELMKGN